VNLSTSGYDLRLSVSNVTVSVDQQSNLLSGSRDFAMFDPLLSSPLHRQTSASCELGGVESRHKLPVFQTEEDRLMFDRSLEVDIAPLVSGMYRSDINYCF